MSLARAEIKGAPTLGPLIEADLRPPITVVCGLNGAGKSRLLRVLAQLVAPGSVPDVAIARQVGGASGLLTIRRGDAKEEYPRPSEAPPLVGVLWFDPVLLTAEIARQFRDLGELEDVLDGVDSRPFDRDLLDFASSIIQRDYTSIESFDLSEDGFAHPYFRLRWGSATYGVEDMALGELSIVYLLYLLSQAGQETMVFLEEPESFVSPVGQVALMDCVHYYCATRALTFLIATHSPAIAAQVPSANLSCVERSPSGTVSVRSPPRLDALSTIEIRERLGGVVFVEDELAAAFTREILRRECASYQHLVEVVMSGDKAKVRTALLSIRGLSRRLSAIGVLDGDARGDSVEPELNVLYLPGQRSPEEVLRAAAAAVPDGLARELSLSVNAIHAALARAAGTDHHDWISALGEALGVETSRMTAALFDVWFDSPENANAAKKLFEDIARGIPGL